MENCRWLLKCGYYSSNSTSILCNIILKSHWSKCHWRAIFAKDGSTIRCITSIICGTCIWEWRRSDRIGKDQTYIPSLLTTFPSITILIISRHNISCSILERYIDHWIVINLILILLLSWSTKGRNLISHCQCWGGVSKGIGAQCYC